MSAPRRILLTRPRERSEAFAATLPKVWEATIWPLTEIHPTEAAPPDMTGAQAVIYTSRAGAEQAPEGVRALPAFCVGTATAGAARAAGHAVVYDARGDAAALIRLVQDRAAKAGALLHIRGEDAAGDIAGDLRRAGFDARDHVAYRAAATETVPIAVADDLQKGRFAAAAFFSPRASAIFAGLMRPDWRHGLASTQAFAISENAAKPLELVGFASISIANAQNANAIRAAICGAG